MSKHFFASEHDYKSFIPQLLQSDAPHYVLFASDLDPETQQPWCPDCAMTGTAISKLVQWFGGSLLEVRIGTKTEWKDPNHPFRQDPLLQLPCIPTLIKWDQSGPSKSVRIALELEVKSEAEAYQVVYTFLKQHETELSSDIVVHASDLKTGLANLVSQCAPHFVVFSADVDGTTHLPWCGDCVRNLPVIIRSLHAAGGTLLEVRVGDKPTWKDPNHPFRLDQQLQLKGIPTLMSWGAEGPIASVCKELEDAETVKESEAAIAVLLSH